MKILVQIEKIIVLKPRMWQLMATLSTPLVPKATAGSCIPAPATSTSVTTRLVRNQARFTVSGIGNPAEPGVGFEQGLVQAPHLR
jgi:hypothetical protein